MYWTICSPTWTIDVRGWHCTVWRWRDRHGRVLEKRITADQQYNYLTLNLDKIMVKEESSLRSYGRATPFSVYRFKLGGYNVHGNINHI